MIPTGKCTFNVGDLMLLSTVIRLLVDQLLQIPKYFSLFGALGGFAARVGKHIDIISNTCERLLSAETDHEHHLDPDLRKTVSTF
jgi:hypothetical protein